MEEVFLVKINITNACYYLQLNRANKKKVIHFVSQNFIYCQFSCHVKFKS